MRPTKDLRKLLKSFERATGRAERLVAGAACSAATSDERYARTRLAVIDLLAAWEQFCRSYFLSWAYGARRACGAKFPCRADSEFEALAPVIRSLRPSAAPNVRDNGNQYWNHSLEPHWHTPELLMRAFDAVTQNGEPLVRQAFGYKANAYHYLPMIRNAFAHRSPRLEMNAMQMSRLSRATGVSRGTRVAVLPLAPSRYGKTSSSWLC